MGVSGLPALVLTVSDGVTAGTRQDRSGEAVESVLSNAGFEVERKVVPDERDEIASVLRTASESFRLVATTGGTGFGPRDVTPEATLEVIEREAPGMGQLMIARGLESTEMAALSRLRVGSRGECLIVNLPGSPKGATESLQAIVGLIPHVCDLLAGDTHH
ncbi:MAG: MogA/MoaB family molybdenum cofactor biosynthesis protein [Actinobacteria bacterium]|nr:MAG: MogA/MoaB family molybdenum cofactor biosynthesis protein [Actinomycetota bacterium]